jgi:hypothetical protein
MTLVRHLLKPGKSLLEIDSNLCAEFTGLFTPDPELIQVCLDSYGEQQSENGAWVIREQDAPSARRADLRAAQQMLKKIARRLELAAEGQTPLLLRDANGEIRYACHVLASAVIGKLIQTHPTHQKFLIVLPDGRANCWRTS